MANRNAWPASPGKPIPFAVLASVGEAWPSQGLVNAEDLEPDLPDTRARRTDTTGTAAPGRI
jgi:hypothetical protein